MHHLNEIMYGGGMFDGIEAVQGPPSNFLNSFHAMSTLNCVGCCCCLIIWIIIAVLTGQALTTAGFSTPPDASEKWKVTQLPPWVYQNVQTFIYNNASVVGDAWSTFLLIIIFTLLAYFAIRMRDSNVIKSLSYCTGCCSICYCLMMLVSIVFMIFIGMAVSSLEDVAKLCNPATTTGLKVVTWGTETTSISPTSQTDCEKLMTELKTPFTLSFVSMIGCCCLLMCWSSVCGFSAKEGLATADIMDAEFGYGGGSPASSSYYG